MRASVIAAFVGLTGCLSTALNSNNASSHVLHEERVGNIHSSWLRRERLGPDTIVPVRIGLKQSNLEAGSDRLMAISHPSSKDYGKHLSAEEVDAMFAPSDAAVSAVRDWLITSGIDDRVIAHSDNKGWLVADISVDQAQQLLQTAFYEYEHSRSGLLRVGSHSYHLPAYLQEFIDYVTPGVKLSAPMKKSLTKRTSSWVAPRRGYRHRPQWTPLHNHPWHKPDPAYSLPLELQACNVNITPPCWRALYGISVSHINTSVDALGVYAQGDYYSGQDLDSWFSSFEPRIPQGTRPTLHSIDGGVAPVAATDPNNGGEADVDLAITMSLIYPQSVVLYQVDDAYYAPEEVAFDNTFNTFLDALDGSYCNYSAYGITGDSDKDPVYPDNHTDGYKGQRMCGTYKPARVITVSYGESEGDFPQNYVKRQCDEFMKLALQGHTVFVASGDYGVGSSEGDPDNGCLSGFGQNQTIFNPDYPSDCPWVTAVGATRLYPNQTVLDAESAMAVDLWQPGGSEADHYFASGGGFSNYFPTPAYQRRALSAYFHEHDPGYPAYVANAHASNIGIDGGRYNRAGRGIPDVSANGAFMLAYVNQTLGRQVGSSLAAPIWAAVVTLINQQRTLAGKGPVGFINPVLYEHPWALNDITNGSNPNCGSAGFEAVSGWDPVTGLGTPNFPKLLEVFLRLP